MNLSSKAKVFLITFILFFSGGTYAQESGIPSEHMMKIEGWLKENDQYRLANLKDCNCDDEIKEIRKGGDVYDHKPKPGYLPYYAAGYFNGLPSFAVIVLRKNEPFQAYQVRIIVFSSKEDDFLPIEINYPFVHDESLGGINLFVRRKTKKIDNLYIGALNSEGKKLNIPQFRTRKK